MSQKIRIQMRQGAAAPGSGILGEDGETWCEGEVREASPAFARWLIDRKRARLAPIETPEPVPADKGGDPVSTAPAVERKPAVPKRSARTRKR